ncbi:hypothetical protein G1H11_12015 [Phytoactinopolyspora alkaliphila]|uniref:MFS transporter n=1 Tax=Phytoactinopolyspora alkaliphila TaxID=1783498 RepID=A0A6N9YM54_9ACTN|nr:hypothetical protein [Phytoactinopolyspora alkaliphila]NED96035.1 hypothetical protein [Phytoactinopolyspora alkaliphila]
MHKPGRGRWRALRGLGMSAACLAMPALAHVTAGGAVPVHIGFLCGAALLSVACVALADRRRNPTEIGAVLLLSQPALHVLLSMSGHGHGATAGGGGGMVVAHVIAAAALTVLLSGAEAVIWAMAALSDTLLTRVRALFTEVVPTGPELRISGAAPDQTRISNTRRVSCPAPRRGPPVLLLR